MKNEDELRSSSFFSASILPISGISRVRSASIFRICGINRIRFASIFLRCRISRVRFASIFTGSGINRSFRFDIENEAKIEASFCLHFGIVAITTPDTKSFFLLIFIFVTDECDSLLNCRTINCLQFTISYADLNFSLKSILYIVKRLKSEINILNISSNGNDMNTKSERKLR